MISNRGTNRGTGQTQTNRGTGTVFGQTGGQVLCLTALEYR
ncbi:MAG: hypothetical protein HPY66_1515 [Firmicutes bacterium]|nr:hypothetical protein [Bacillota bacterium]